MVLQSQLYPPVVHAHAADYYSNNGYRHQDDYYSEHGYAQKEDYCYENAYYNSGSSMPQMKPYANVPLPQPSKHQMVGYESYDQHKNGLYGNHQNYHDYNSDAYTNEPFKGKHQSDGYYNEPFKGKHQSDGYYRNHNSHDYGPTTYETMRYSCYSEGGHDRCPPFYDHKNHQNLPFKGVQSIDRSLDD
ncbi:hypothetical protein ACH5RR_030749 [Cinchona calisaya]|uniref:Uncharacterized protein n=1 Tax=Cinchona calisaya TaxID=153742 RepID=A0ABD2YVK3_9GENT